MSIHTTRWLTLTLITALVVIFFFIAPFFLSDHIGVVLASLGLGLQFVPVLSRYAEEMNGRKLSGRWKSVINIVSGTLLLSGMVLWKFF